MMFQGTKYLAKYQRIKINRSVGSGQSDEINPPICYENPLRGLLMHNILSTNQLRGWSITDKTIDNTQEKINDYFDCIIECHDTETGCIQTCKTLLE